MVLDPRTPVVVGAGQVTVRPGAEPVAPEPLLLMVRAVEAALADAGGRRHRLLGAIGSVRVVRTLQWSVPDPGALVAERVGFAPRESLLSTVGGNTPQALVAATAAAIQAGKLDAAVIVGAECGAARARARRAGEWLTWTAQDDATPPATPFGEDRTPLNDAEQAVGLALPVQVYPLLENARRVAAGWSLAEQRARIGSLWSRFSSVAAENPHAWLGAPVPPEEIVAPAPDNRMIAFPYPKRCTANIQVDQGAALLCCSAEVAEAAGVERDRWVFPLSGAEANDHWFISERPELWRSPAIAAAGRGALELAGLGIDDIAVADLYSCFPAVVQTAAHELGIPIDGDVHRLTLTGGLTFGGGPGNNYATHSIASLVDALRRRPGSAGMATGLGWFATKHAIGVYGTEPPAGGFRSENVQAAVDALERYDADPDPKGAFDLETFTVLYGRDGEPERAVVSARTGPQRRGWATLTEPGGMEALVAAERPSWTGTFVGDGRFELGG